jgi:hypothetical protein
MRRLYVDTATTGLTLYRESDADPRQPHIGRLAILATAEGMRPTGICRLIKPEPGWEWEAGAGAGHGITRTDAEARGVPLGEAMDTLLRALQGTDELVAFNWEFHRRLLMRSMVDLGSYLEIPPTTRQICAMRAATPVIKKPKEVDPATRKPVPGYEWPKLAEAYAYFSGGEELPPIDADPIATGKALVNATRVIHEGTVAHRDGQSRQQWLRADVQVRRQSARLVVAARRRRQ